MSKRQMDEQGGGERYGFTSEMGNTGDSRPLKATAAQMAKRNIAPLKRRPGSGKSSRQASPAITTGVPQTQSFQPPTANFNFSFGNSDNTPSFGGQPQQNGTPSFSFGAPQPDPNQQNGGTMPGNNPFSGGGFGAQQATNGFNTSNTPGFGQNNNAAASPAQFSFGQQQPQPTPQTNGTSFGGFGQTNGASSSGFSFGGQQEKPKEGTPSFSFGGQPPQSKENTPSFSFGQPAQSKENTPSFAFGGQSEQPKASTPSFAFGSTNAAETPKPSTPGFSFGTSQPEQPQAQPAPSFTGFGQSTSDQANKTNTGLFGATPASSASTGNGQSVFDSVKQPNGIKQGMFTASASQTPKASTPFNFAPQTEKKDTNKAVGFSLGGQSSTAETPKPTNNLFNFGPSASDAEQTPKPANPFSGFGQSQAETPKTANIFSSTKVQPAATPKPGFPVGEDASMTTPESTPKQPEQAKPASVPSETPARKSLFERMTPADPPATAQKLNLGSSMFDKPKTTGETPKAPSKGLFERIETPAAAPNPATSLFSAPAAASSTTPAPTASSAQARPSIQYSSRTPTAKDWVKLGNLNNALLGHLKTQDMDVDWSPILTLYIQEAAKLMGKEAYAQFAQPATSATPAAPAPGPSASSSIAATSNRASNFSTPKPSAPGSLLRHVDPPATAPVNKKRPAEDDSQPPPATEKRARPNEPSYPSLPDTASKTAKLFASTLDKATDANKAKPGAGASSTSLFSTSAAPPSASAPSGGFKPSGISAPASGNFFASFGKQAAENEEKERKKRKQEDYDSEDDDEAEWEAKDKAAQEAKKRKIEEAAKSGTGFVFKPTTGTSTSSSIFSFGNKDDAATDKTQGEKVQGTGDNTWKPETPIKFGASTNGFSSTTPAAAPPANPFGGLFGASATPKPDTAKLAPPSVGFNFGATKAASVDTSRATTPGVTTDGETSNAGDGGPSDEQNDEQVEDMTNLMPEESAGHEVLFETRMARGVKLEQKKTLETQPNGLQASWVEKGRGPLYVLKNTETGKTRVLLKVPPLGRAAMNFATLGVEYKKAPGKDKFVQGTFIDHLGSDEDRAGKPSTWHVQFRETSEANQFMKVLNSNKP